MFMEERHHKIISILHEKGKVNVKDLSEMFNNSESTIRKDLQFLENSGKLKRTYGGAILNERTIVEKEHYLTQRLSINSEIKEKIADKAFNIIQDNDVIFLDVCSTSYLLAKILINSDKRVTIITNMPIISSMITQNTIQKFIFIGGEYNIRVGGNIGPSSVEEINKYRCNKAFIGCSGVDIHDESVTVTNSADAFTKKAIINVSKLKYLLTPNDRLTSGGVYNFSKISDYDALIMDSSPGEKTIKTLEHYNVVTI